MNWAIFSDVHGNYEALTCFIDSTKFEVDGYLCLGDIVGYGPNSNECVERIMELSNLQIVAGNHENLFLGDGELDSALPLVQEFHQFSSKSFRHKETIKKFPETLEFYNYECSHTINKMRIYKNSDLEISKNHIIGHTHQQFERKIGNFKIINPGSVGQNREWINMVDFAIYDSEQDYFHFRSIEYNFDDYYKKMLDFDYSINCLDYYKNKKIYKYLI